MATYFLFGRYSADAVKGMSSARTEKATQLIQKYGGELKSMHIITGEYDIVIMATFPGLSNVVKAIVSITKLTGIGFVTCEAIPVEEFDRIVADV